MDYICKTLKGLNYVFHSDMGAEPAEDETFIRVLNHSFLKVGNYVNIKNMPEIFFYDPLSSAEIKKELELKDWVVSVSSKGNIHFFSDFFDKPNQGDILSHELFHCGVYQCSQGRFIPMWFNEAIAYFIGRNTRVSHARIRSILEAGTHKIKDIILADSLIGECSECYGIIKSIGGFAGGIFECTTIKDIISKTCECDSFEKAFLKATSVTIEKFIDNWLLTIKK